MKSSSNNTRTPRGEHTATDASGQATTRPTSFFDHHLVEVDA